MLLAALALNSILLPGGVAIYSGQAEHLLLTSTRRDLLPPPRPVIVPAGEAAALEDPAKFWRLFAQLRFHDYAQKTTKVPVVPLPIARTVRGGDVLTFGPTKITVLDTPGYSPAAVSYLFEQNGKRVIATGDLIYSGGRILDLYSLQNEVPETKTRGYHGFAARAGQLIASLRSVAAQKPDRLLPARGPAIEDPQKEIALLISRLERLLDSHFSTDALRWYWGEESWQTRAKLAMGRAPSAPMPMSEQRDLPNWIIPIGNSRLLVSPSGAAFLLDAGYPQIIEKLEELQAAGRFKNLEGLWITHYHDDHTDHASKVAKRFGAKVLYSNKIQDIVENPGRYRMPCLTTNPITGEVKGEADSWQWREFRMASYFFPGQTLYHGGLHIERESGEKIFFVGDSFTPSGTDDYCLQNRNFTGEDEGYLYCLRLLEKLGGNPWLINQHVLPMFRYDAARVDRMRLELRRRAQLLAELTPLPHANYAVDESWARVYPYASSGEPLELRLMNHTDKEQTFRVKWHLPAGWTVDRADQTIRVPARTEGKARLTLKKSGATQLGVLTAD
ncbi:MAG: MBL fold metallo-hydrolase, partial [Acidobacteria bacterium]|nr:MBL fold metallo-hydrolase [Acidobacteriota bacterium]